VTSPSPNRRRLSFLADERAIAAVEMAFIAPVALIMFGLAVAGGQSLSIYHKVVLAAHTATDLVSRTPYSRDPNIANAEAITLSAFNTDLALSQMVLYPYDPTNLTMVVSELAYVSGSNNKWTVQWSQPYNGGVALTAGTTLTLDPSYAQSGATYLLYGQATYTFQPIGGVLSLPAITLNATETLTIRNAPQLTAPTS
jgi:Flp pilus assembly protein TadG